MAIVGSGTMVLLKLIRWSDKPLPKQCVIFPNCRRFPFFIEIKPGPSFKKIGGVMPQQRKSAAEGAIRNQYPPARIARNLNETFSKNEERH
jgi:hypothetical protein